MTLTQIAKQGLKICRNSFWKVLPFASYQKTGVTVHAVRRLRALFLSTTGSGTNIDASIVHRCRVNEL
jgi:hypothetical protein